MNADADLIVSGGTSTSCLLYMQGYETGYTGNFQSYTGMTDVQAREIMGPDYAKYIQNVYQMEGVDAFTHPDPAIRQWGVEFLAKYGDYPIDLVPWCWDQIMVVISAAYNAGTVEPSDAFINALRELPFDFLLADHLKTPMAAQRGNKFFDVRGQALMEVMICGWTEEGIKIPKVFMTVTTDTGEILGVTYPTSQLIDDIIEEYNLRNP